MDFACFSKSDSSSDFWWPNWETSWAATKFAKNPITFNGALTLASKDEIIKTASPAPTLSTILLAIAGTFS